MWEDCYQCHNTGKLPTVGSMEIECPNCRIRRRSKFQVKRFIEWIRNNPLKHSPVKLTLIIFALALIIFYEHPNYGTLNILFGTFGLIFVALKYKLDQAHYHKELFNKRFALYQQVHASLKCHLRDELTLKIYDELALEIKTKGYFLFSQDTYLFLEKYLHALYIIVHFTKISEQQTSDEIKNELQKARAFLSALVDQQKLAKYFPELKITCY